MDLRFPRPGDWSVGLSPRSHRVAVGIWLSVGEVIFGMADSAGRRADIGNLHLAHINGSTGRSAPSFPALLPALPVCCEVERNEKEKIGADDSHSCKGSKLLAGTFAIVGKVREICRSEICVGSKIDKT